MSAVDDLAVLESGVLTNQEEKQQEELLAPKVKKPRTDKQIEATKKMNEARKQKALEKKDIQAKQDEELKKEMEGRAEEIKDKIIKKAIAIKKRQIKKEAVLDEIEDDETPIEKINEIMKKTRITARNQLDNKVTKPKVEATTPQKQQTLRQEPPVSKFKFVE
jgi:hypothetical protein